MDKEFLHFEKINRETWQNLHRKTTPPLSQTELNSIKSFNDRINLQDVRDVYLPLTNLMTTDGFLYPNAILKEQELLNRKGFPESYDMELLLDFLNQIKNNKSVEIPVYSHEIYDIVPDEKQTILPADFVIVEGINVFQNPQNDSLYMTDFFDFSIYVDAAVNDIESWYIDRFQKLLALAQNDPNNYYYRFTEQPLEEVLSMAHQVWESINLVNLQHYIQPTRNRADLILHKATNHEIDEIYLKR